MEYEDKNITCVDCGNQFVHSADQQARFAARGLQNEPKRCPECREARRSRRGGSGNGRGRSRSGDHPQRSQAPLPKAEESPVAVVTERREAGSEPSAVPAPASTPQAERSEHEWPDPKDYNHTVQCAECGAETRVPFKSTENTPVYCNRCFLAKLPA